MSLSGQSPGMAPVNAPRTRQFRGARWASEGQKRTLCPTGTQRERFPAGPLAWGMNGDPSPSGRLPCAVAHPAAASHAEGGLVRLEWHTPVLAGHLGKRLAAEADVGRFLRNHAVGCVRHSVNVGQMSGCKYTGRAGVSCRSPACGGPPGIGSRGRSAYPARSRPYASAGRDLPHPAGSRSSG